MLTEVSYFNHPWNGWDLRAVNDFKEISGDKYVSTAFAAQKDDLESCPAGGKWDAVLSSRVEWSSNWWERKERVCSFFFVLFSASLASAVPFLLLRLFLKRSIQEKRKGIYPVSSISSRSKPFFIPLTAMQDTQLLRRGWILPPNPGAQHDR